ncbi:hypothetical protein CPT_Privateer_127 [Proteus phage Privateer]|uniref:Uncharacterized protein n=1 Tax=Proteus phage Privateer TaxID=2712958 RepID=A0A6G8R3Y1_9CAUD|nr:hypothetical protein HWD17_gp129 [Proteus phage Privateer]QIN94917.1 hypothetical protein CPT_Privateer_127 [Proteus phage Privateer]
MATLKYKIKKFKKSQIKSASMLVNGDVYKGNNGDLYAVTGKTSLGLYVSNLRTGCSGYRSNKMHNPQAKPRLIVIGSIDITSMQIR